MPRAPRGERPRAGLGVPVSQDGGQGGDHPRNHLRAALGKPEPCRNAGQERTFMGFFTAALRGRKLVGKSTLAELLLFVGGVPTGPSGLASSPSPKQIHLEDKKKKDFPDPKCPSSCHGTGIST